jgi:hypothetical protein
MALRRIGLDVEGELVQVSTTEGEPSLNGEKYMIIFLAAIWMIDR